MLGCYSPLPLSSCLSLTLQSSHDPTPCTLSPHSHTGVWPSAGNGRVRPLPWPAAARAVPPRLPHARRRRRRGPHPLRRCHRRMGTRDGSTGGQRLSLLSSLLSSLLLSPLSYAVRPLVHMCHRSPPSKRGCRARRRRESSPTSGAQHAQRHPLSGRLPRPRSHPSTRRPASARERKRTAVPL